MIPTKTWETMVNAKQWVAWRFEERDGRTTKVPVNPHNGKYARTNAPETWATASPTTP